MPIEQSKKNIITITGDLASGKSTVTTMLAEELGYKIYRNGEYARQYAKDHGMDITQFNIFVKDHPEIDNQIENSAAEYAKNNNEIIVDARLGWYAVPYSFKVYLSVNLDVSAQRAFADPTRKDSEKFDTLEEQKQDIMKRYKMENDRFFELYGVRRDDMSNYDFVLDTTNLTKEQTKELIKEEYFKWLEK